MFCHLKNSLDVNFMKCSVLCSPSFMCSCLWFVLVFSPPILSDCVFSLHWPAGLHLLLRSCSMVVLQAAATSAVLPTTWGRCREGTAGGVSGNYPQQSPRATQIQEGSALQCQECHLIWSHFSHHSLWQVKVASISFFFFTPLKNAQIILGTIFVHMDS